MINFLSRLLHSPIFYPVLLILKNSKFFLCFYLFCKKDRLLKTRRERLFFLLETLKKVKKIRCSGSKKSSSLLKLFKTVDIDVRDGQFFYSIDPFTLMSNKKRVMDNCSIDYSVVLEKGLEDFYEKDVLDNEYVKEKNKTIDAIKIYLNRCILNVNNSTIKNKKNISLWLEEILKKPATSLDSALQRILFYNQILWQTGHTLVGLGRLDYILDRYSNENYSDEEIFSKLYEFCLVLHNYYWFKSSALLGDTGQVIILGGKKEDGSYFENRFTTIFMQVIKKLQLPDPKILLRVSSQTTPSVWHIALDCANTGVGSPLFSNDDVVIPALEKFGYDYKDAVRYITSACWEPIPAGGLEQNNLQNIIFLKPLDCLIKDKKFLKIKNFDELMQGYFDNLSLHLKDIEKKLDSIKWEKDPIISMTLESCNLRRMDISDGGGKYNNYGILSVSLSNTVNALLNIRELVFKQSKYSLMDVKNCCTGNYAKNEAINLFLKNSKKYFGFDDPDVLELINLILEKTDSFVREYRNCFKGKIKFGLSSPSYIMESSVFPASFDGRKKGDPFAVHISNENCNSFTELLQFAACLDYSGSKMNGNVVDFFVSPQLVSENKDQFERLIKQGILNGVFQIQMNVIGSAKLIEARKNPESFPNLIVRVWGFSAYFNDLPDDYKEYLIQRALQSEHIA